MQAQPPHHAPKSKEAPPTEFIEVPKVDAKTAATQLHALRDIAPPPPVSWRPQTAGWIVLALVVLAAIAWALWHAARRYRVRRYRREALTELDRLESVLHDPAQRRSGLWQLSALVKRTRLSEAPRAVAAGLSGEAWMRQLDETWKPEFSDGPGQPLADVVYRSRAQIDALTDQELAALTATVRRWISRHHAAVR